MLFYFDFFLVRYTDLLINSSFHFDNYHQVTYLFIKVNRHEKQQS